MAPLSPEPVRTEPVVAVVVAAGSGVRLGGDVPKALRDLAGRPLLLHAVDRLRAGGVTHLVVVVPEAQRARFDAILAGPLGVGTGSLGAGHVGGEAMSWRTVPGGAQRQESVRCGLELVAADPQLATAEIVLIHDAARPLVPPEVVGRVIAAVRAGARAVIPVIPVVDTIRQLAADGSRVIDRSTLRAVQTPQGFDRRTVTAAHALVARDGVRVTDDAAVCEYAGHVVELVPGDPASHKITGPVDLAVAAALLADARGREVS